MTREQIAKIFPEATTDQISGLLNLHHEELQGVREELSTATAERDTYRTQLDGANNTIKSYQDMDIDGIRQSAKDWETKYNEDTAALQGQLADMRYNQAAQAATEGLKFSSASAKKAFMADLRAKELEVSDKGLNGFDDFLKSYQESDPDAFAAEESTNKPRFVTPGAQAEPTAQPDWLAGWSDRAW